MILKIGSYSFQDNSVQFSVNRRAIRGQTGRRMMYREQWVVWGNVRADSASNLTTALQGLETGVADGQTAVYLDNSSAETIHKMDTANAINGVRVVGGVDYTPGQPNAWGAGVEYHNRRSFRFTLDGTFLDQEGTGIVMYREVGQLLASGDPDFVIQEALTGLPQMQTVAQVTKQVYRQSGEASGLDGPVDFPGPIWSSSFLKPRPFLKEISTPGEWGTNQNTMYRTRWMYHFEAPTGFTATQPAEPAF